MIALLALLGCLLAISIPSAASAEADKGAQNPATSEKSKGAYLGLSLAPLHPAVAAHLSDVIGKGRGVMVTNVVGGSPAYQAGIGLHDIVVSYDKQDLYSAEQLVKLVQIDRPDREVVIGFVHRGQLKEAKIRLEASPLQEVARQQTSFRLPFDDLLPESFGWLRNGSLGSVMFKEDKAESPWKSIQSLTIRKTGGKQFEASIEYRAQDGKTMSREFSGTRAEIRKSVEQDDELPNEVRSHLLRSLDQQSPFELIPGAPGGRWDQPSRNEPAAEF
jgi:membrane-associated protease RseP (regulator of RpoE activity)